MARSTDRPPRGSARRPESPFLPPAPRPQLPPAEPRLQQRGVAALTLAVLSLLAMVLSAGDQEAAHRAAVVAAVALAVAAAGLVLAITAMSGAKRGGTRRPRGALVGVILGVIGLLLSGLALLGFLVFSAQWDQYDNCLNGANTVAEQQACQTQLENAVTNRIRAAGGN
jgi:multisubunit Na+/H+ antiporter MnhB subunit